MSEAVRRMFSEIAPKYDTANSVLSLGVHHYWRKKTVRLSEAKVGDAVLDCATGTGDMALEFKNIVGNSGTVVGTDFCQEMMLTAPEKARKQAMEIEFSIADVMNLPFKDNSFDIASIAFGIRNVDKPEVGISEMARVVRPGGRIVILEFGQPKGVFGLLYDWYSRTLLPLIGGIITGKKEAYNYLQRTSSNFPCRDEFVDIMNHTKKFTSTKFVSATGGVVYIYVGVVQ